MQAAEDLEVLHAKDWRVLAVGDLRKLTARDSRELAARHNHQHAAETSLGLPDRVGWLWGLHAPPWPSSLLPTPPSLMLSLSPPSSVALTSSWLCGFGTWNKSPRENCLRGEFSHRIVALGRIRERRRSLILSQHLGFFRDANRLGEF